MLCCALMSVRAGQWVMMSVRLWVLVFLVYADFVDSLIYYLSVSGKRGVMPATKPAEVYLVRTWYSACSE